MKRILFLLLTAFSMLNMQAQRHVRVWNGADDDRKQIAKIGDMTFGEGTLTIRDQVYPLSNNLSIEVVPLVTVTYNGSTATVDVPAIIQSSFRSIVSGANVSLVNTNTDREVEILVKGSSSNGKLIYNGSYKCTFILEGLDLKSNSGAAFDIQCGKRVAMELAEGTINTLTDQANGAQSACLYCKGHLELSGMGTLNVTGNTKHAIATKEYMEIKKNTGTINIVGAKSDGIHAGQYFEMKGGTINIDAKTLGDGIQVKALQDPDKEHDGQLFIKSGILTITTASDRVNGIGCDADASISGGIFDMVASGAGSRCINVAGNLTIGATDTTSEEASDGPKILAKATGGIQSDKACCGIKVDGNLTVNKGVVVVTNSGEGALGILCSGNYVKNGGTVNASISK